MNALLVRFYTVQILRVVGIMLLVSLRKHIFFLAWFAAQIGAVTVPVGAEPPKLVPLTPQQRNGKRIFFRGESNAGRPVQAALGDPPMLVSAKMLPCANCHGFDARGLTEAGVLSPNISWSVLTKSYGTVQPTGRRRSAYDDATLARAITRGIDSSSNRLGVGMPKFKMDEADLASLIAYLKRVETDFDPGVTDTEIVLATILPRAGTGNPPASALADLLRARFRKPNKTGGIYGRQIKLLVTDAADEPAQSVEALRVLLETEPVFAVIAPFVPGGAGELAALASELEIPIIVPIAGPPIGVDESNRFVFYLHSSLDMQVRVLVDDVVEHERPGGRSNFVVVSRSDSPFETLARVVRDRFEEHGVGHVGFVVDDGTPGSVAVLPKLLAAADGVFLLGSDDDAGAWLAQTTMTGVSPNVFMVSASLGERTLTAAREYHGDLVCAFPNSRSAQSPRARAAFSTFMKRNHLGSAPDAASVGAYCGASLLLKALESAGRQLRRERLIRELEGLYEFPVGLTHDISYGPNERIGVRGAYIVTFRSGSGKTQPDSRWVEFTD